MLLYFMRQYLLNFKEFTMAPNMFKVEIHRLRVLPIHKYPNYLEACCEIINEEWPRSYTARMNSLKASGDKLPTSLVLTLDEDVIGHCKLTPIPSIPESCFVESVVIRKDMRGLKLGKYLMNKAEEYCKDFLHLTHIHLSTIDKEEFYRKLGYTECEPVSIYGGLAGKYQPSQPRSKDQSVERPNSAVAGKRTPVTSFAPPPPPLPMPAVQPHSRLVKKQKVYMVKKL